MATRKQPSSSRLADTPKQLKAYIRQIETRRADAPPRTRRLGERQLFAFARTRLDAATLRAFPHRFPARMSDLPDIEPAMELTPRQPYNDVGHMDGYRPGRWDTESNLVFMSPIVQTGPSAGQWDGTVMYVKCKAPQTGTYLVAATFGMYSSPTVGLDVLLRMSGPWGVATSTGPTTEVAAVTALWSGNAGKALSFSVTCLNGIIAYLQSVRLYLLD